MKKNILVSLFLAAALACGGCATISKSTVFGPVHPKIKPAMVVIYSSPPSSRYDEVADVAAVSRRTMQDAINALKKQAAKVGANGLLIKWTGTQYGGSMGYSVGSATAYGNAYGATAFGSSTAVSVPIYYQCARGTAIYIYLQ